MSGTDAALRQRFRGVLAARAERLLELIGLSGVESRASVERREMLGELHTLKGEAKMLGWSRLATLAHALEEHLGAESLDIDAARVVVDAMVLSLSDHTGEEQAEDLWRTALFALTGEEVDGEETKLRLDSIALPVVSADDPAGDAPDVEGAKRAEADKKRWVHVEADIVDSLGEALATFSSDFSRFASRTQNHHGANVSVSARETEADAERLRSALSGILLLSLSLRLTPVQPVFARLAAHARTLARERGKSLDVILRSDGARVEREVLERLSEPLLHLVSNAVDHGIEAPENRHPKAAQGVLELKAESRGALVVLSIRDDGRGIDQTRVLKRAIEEGRLSPDADASEALQVLFQPGFSTNETADEVSGRGMGLDVVKRLTESMGVQLKVESRLGEGTTFSLFVPAVLTQENLLVVRAQETLYGIPGRAVLSVLENDDQKGQKTLRFQGETVPVRSFAATLGLGSALKEARFIVVELGGKRFALKCEQVIGHFDLIRRPTGSNLREGSGICASAQTDQDELVLVLDEGYLSNKLSRGAVSVFDAPEAKPVQRRRILVVDDSVVVRKLLEGVLTASGFEVCLAEHGQKALSLIDAFRPGLVLSDIEMPVMGGFELLRQLRERHPHLPVVLVTARSSDADQKKALELGANAYVTKGEFASDSLVKVVERFYREK